MTERLTEEIATRKRRIRDLARQLMPTSGRALSGQLSRADLEVLRTWGATRQSLRAGGGGLAFGVLVSDVAATVTGFGHKVSASATRSDGSASPALGRGRAGRGPSS